MQCTLSITPTIIGLVAVNELNKYSEIERMIVSTYQAVSGSGHKGVEDLENGLRGEEPKTYPHPIVNNCLPHIDKFLENGYTKEEIKMIDETRKILGIPDLPVTATCVRVPVMNSHSVSITAELERDFDLEEVKEALGNFAGMVLVDDVNSNEYPLASDATGQDKVLVGRVRRDFSTEKGINLWVVADNIRKGAATNAVQIAELFRGM